MYNIAWKGDKCKNFYAGRRGHKPIGACNHITAGTKGSVHNWFISPNSNASSNFLVNRDGSIDQFVRIEDGAYTQGISGTAFDRATAPIVRERKGVNPNFYLIGIEHEGYDGNGVDGDLTEKQFYASCWLHKWCQSEVMRIYGQTYSLDPYHIVGHFQIDPVRKPFCPGNKFPWSRMYAELSIADTMTLGEYEEHLDFLQSGNANVARIFALYTRMVDLRDKLSGKFGKEAERKIILLADTVVGAGQYVGEATALGIANRIIKLYLQWQKKEPYHEEALRKLLLILKGAIDLKIVS